MRDLSPARAAAACPPLSVLVADDHVAYRDGIAGAIAAHPELELVGEASDGVDALAAIARLEPDVALLDLRMPGFDGFEVCRRLGRLPASPATAVVVMSALADPGVSRLAEEAGAAAWVDKVRPRREICQAIVDAARRSAC